MYKIGRIYIHIKRINNGKRDLLLLRVEEESLGNCSLSPLIFIKLFQFLLSYFKLFN